MTENEIEKIARGADMVIAGFSFTLSDFDCVRVLNLYNPLETCVLLRDGEVLETTMDNVVLAKVQAYYLKNLEFMRMHNA